MEAKLDIKIPKVLRDELKAEAKEANMFFGPYVVSLIQKSRKPKRLTSPGLVAVDPHIDKVIEHFEANVAKVKSRRSAILAARDLIDEHGFEKVIGAINAVKASKGKKYAPVIASLPTLQEKWANLEHFYLTKQTGSKEVYSA